MLRIAQSRIPWAALAVAIGIGVFLLARADRASAPPTTPGAIFTGSSCSASEQGHEAEVILYAASPVIATCDRWIQTATGNTGLFSGLWVPGLLTPRSNETQICELTKGDLGLRVLDQKGGDIGTTICIDQVHGGWSEVAGY